MQVYHVLLCILIVRGGECIQYILQRQNMACLLDYADVQPAQLHNKTCTTIGSNSVLYLGYMFTQESIFDIDGPYSTFTLNGSPFNITSEAINTYRYDTNQLIRRFFIDWFHKEVYIVLDRIVSAPMTKSDQMIPLNIVLTRDDIAFVIGVTRRWVEIHEVQIDPYRRYLFFLVSKTNLPDREMIIIRSDLSGKKLFQVLKTTVPQKYCKMYVNVNDLKLYVSVNETMYIYNYEGKLLREVHLPGIPMDLVVFNDSVYLTVYLQVNRTSGTSTGYGNTIYELVLNQSEEPLEVRNVYHLNITGDCTVRVLDARVQRRIEGGKYICDRTDCPELCEVEPSGDTCVCLHTKARTRDGVMCYDCGQSNLTSLLQQPAIVNGHVSYPGDFPWHVVIYNTNYEQVCGGTLISSKVVLTAAHCVTLPCVACTPTVMKPEELKVALGKTQRPWNITEPYDVRRNVTKIIVREGYKGPSTNYANDIALVIMDSEVSINSHVMPACLDYNLNRLPPYETLTSYVSGFGFTKDCGRSCSNFSDTLIYTTGTAVNLSDCLKALHNIDSSLFHRLTSDKYCMGNGTASAVQKGDSGGGLTSVYQGLHYVTGVASVKLTKYDEDFLLK